MSLARHGERIQVEPHAIVADRDVEPCPVSREQEVNLRGMSMLPHVDQDLLGDAIQDDPDLRRWLLREPIDYLVGGAPVGQILLEGEPQGRRKPFAVEDGRSKLEEELAETIDRLPHRLVQRLQGAELFGLDERPSEQLQMHPSGDHHLDRIVVDVVRDPPTLLFLGRDQPREQHPSLVQAVLELGGAFPNPPVEEIVMAPELELKRPRLQEVLDAEEHLRAIERLGQEVLRAEGKRPLLGLQVRVCGQNEDRNVVVGGDQPLQRSQRLEPIQPGHVQVEKDEVWIDLHEVRESPSRIGGAANVLVTGSTQHAFQQRGVRLLVVDDQDA